MWLTDVYLIVFSPVIEVYGTKKSDISDNTSEQDQLIVAFGVFMGFAEYEKNIEYHQTYPLRVKNVTILLATLKTTYCDYNLFSFVTWIS